MSGPARWLVRTAKGLAALVALLAAALGVWWLLAPATSAIPGEHAIAELRTIELGGFPQAALLRGADRRNPVLLYVHGGPGNGQLPIAKLYSDRLEQHFVVVHWDQRGAGASCAGVDWSTLSLDRIVADAIELAEKLGGGRKIFLIGHSWGSLVGALAAQRRWLDAFHGEIYDTRHAREVLPAAIFGREYTRRGSRTSTASTRASARCSRIGCTSIC